MKTCIRKYAAQWFAKHPKMKEWAWFIGLWLLGLSTVAVGVYPLKKLIKIFS